MAHKQTEIRQAVRTALEQQGASVTLVGLTRGNHQFLEFIVGGRTKRVFIPCTPSDRRSTLNAISTARKMVREMKETA